MADPVVYKFDIEKLTGKEIPKGKLADIKAQIGRYIVEEILQHVGDGKTPVRGGKYKRSLSKEYKKRKAEISSSLFANMELEGDMLNSLVFKKHRGSEISVGIWDSKEAAKADGHNNHSGKSKLPPREFIPKDDQTFKKSIIDGMKEIIDGS